MLHAPTPFTTTDAYESARGAALMALIQAGEEHFDAAVQLALRGPWKAEADAAPAGTVISTSEERLRATENPHILSIMDAYDALYAAYRALSRGEGG